MASCIMNPYQPAPFFSARRRQRGIALLSVLLALSLMVILAAELTEAFRQQLRRNQSQQSMDQAYWYVTSGEQPELLAALYIDKLPVDQAATVLNNRPESGWKSVSEFTSQPDLANFASRSNGTTDRHQQVFYRHRECHRRQQQHDPDQPAGALVRISGKPKSDYCRSSPVWSNFMSPPNNRLLLWLPEHDNQPVHWQAIANNDSSDCPVVIQRGSWPSVAEFIYQFPEAHAGGLLMKSLPVLAIVPASQVTLHTLEVPGRITPTVQRSLPWRLEDELIDDVDNFHMALLDHLDNLARLAVTSEINMTRWQQWLNDAGAHAGQWLPASLLLPVEAQHGYQLTVDDQVIIRYGQWQTATGDTLWQEQLWEAIEQKNPDLTLIDLGDIDQFDHLAALQSPLPNLLQGQWRVTSPLQNQWHRWRNTALLAGVFLALFIGNALYTIGQLEQQASQQELAAQQIFKQLFPNERVMVLKTQMQQKLAALQTPTDSGPGLLDLLNTVAPVLGEFQQLRADSLNYDGEQLNIRARAPDFETFNRLRTRLEQAEPIQVGIEALERDGEQVTGSLVISEKEV